MKVFPTELLNQCLATTQEVEAAMLNGEKVIVRDNDMCGVAYYYKGICYITAAYKVGDKS